MEENIVNIFFLLFKSLYFNIEYSKYSFISLFLIGAGHYLHFFLYLVNKTTFCIILSSLRMWVKNYPFTNSKWDFEFNDLTL